MKLKNPNLPYILAPVVYCLHLWLVMTYTTPEARGGGALGAMILFVIFGFFDALFGLLLLWLVLSDSFRWRTRTRCLWALGSAIAACWIATTVLSDGDFGISCDLQLSAFFGGQLLAWSVGMLTLRLHPYLREK